MRLSIRSAMLGLAFIGACDVAYLTCPEQFLRQNPQPRVVKRKMSNFKLKRPEHRALPQPTQPFSQIVVLLPMPLPVLI